MTTADQAFVSETLGPDVARVMRKLEGRPSRTLWRELLALLDQQHPDLMALGTGCSEYIVPGQIGRANLLSACYSFWECVELMAEDIARTGRVTSVRAALDSGKTVRSLMESLYDVTPQAPGESEYTSDRFEAKVLRKRIRHFEAVVGRNGTA
jgi:hypothetical protein